MNKLKAHIESDAELMLYIPDKPFAKKRLCKKYITTMIAKLKPGFIEILVRCAMKARSGPVEDNEKYEKIEVTLHLQKALCESAFVPSKSLPKILTGIILTEGKRGKLLRGLVLKRKPNQVREPRRSYPAVMTLQQFNVQKKADHDMKESKNNS